MKKINIRENQFHCPNCSHVYSFYDNEIKIKEVRKEEKRSGNNRERWARWKEKRENKTFIEQKNQECQHEWETISDFQSLWLYSM